MRRFITESGFLTGYYLYRSGRTDIGRSLLEWAMRRWFEDSKRAVADVTAVFSEFSTYVKAMTESVVSLMLTLNRLQAMEAS